MSWERKLLHCGPRADRGDLLAHYLFISARHHWLPRGSDHAWTLTAQAACGGQSTGHDSQMDSCMLLEKQFRSLRSLCCQEASWSKWTRLFCLYPPLWYSKEILIDAIPVHFFCMVPAAWNEYFRHPLIYIRFSELVSKLSLTISEHVLRYLWNMTLCHLDSDLSVSAVPIHKMQNDLNRGVELWKSAGFVVLNGGPKPSV